MKPNAAPAGGDAGDLPERDEFSGIQFQWHGNMLKLGAIWIACVGFDLRHSPPINAYVGNNENIIGWFYTHEAARAGIVRYIRSGDEDG